MPNWFFIFRRPLLLALVGYVIVLVAFKYFGVLDRVADDDPSHWAGQRCVVVGTVSAQPDPRPSGCVYLIDVETIEAFLTLNPSPRSGEGPRVRPVDRHSSQGQLLLQILNSTAPIAAPGDRLRMIGRLQRPRAALVPGVFDYQDYLSDKGIHTTVYTSSRSVDNLGDSGRNPFTRFGWRVKQKAVAVFERTLDGEQATVLSGLAVGNRPRFYPDLRRIFIESGTMHVLVASGSNVAFVIALCFLMLRVLLIPPRWSLALTLPCVWVYVWLAGADAPIARAGVMGTIGVLAFLLDRENSAAHALGVTALVILIASPRALFDIGFQMSFVTVFGLIYFLTPLETLISKAPIWTRWPIRLLAATLTAQIWLVPITAATFQRFFPIGLVSNVIVVPLAGLGLSAGALLAAASKIPGVVWTVKMYLHALIGIVRFFSDHWGNGLWVAPFPMVAVIGFYLGCFSVVGLRRSLACRIIFGGGLVLIAIGFVSNLRQMKRPDTLTVTWIDTGKRLTALIETTDGKRVLINPGPLEPYDTTERILMPFLTRRGIRSIDAVFLTDRNPDRTASVASLMKWVNVSTVIYCGSSLLQITSGNDTLIFCEPLKLAEQDYLLSLPIKRTVLIQSHFPRNWRWREEFLTRFKPKLVVETNNVSDFRPSVPPWEDVPMVVPQKLGWYRWDLKSTTAFKERNKNKTSGEAARVRPPGDAAHFAARGDR